MWAIMPYLHQLVSALSLPKKRHTLQDELKAKRKQGSQLMLLLEKQLSIHIAAQENYINAMRELNDRDDLYDDRDTY